MTMHVHRTVTGYLTRNITESCSAAANTVVTQVTPVTVA